MFPLKVVLWKFWVAKKEYFFLFVFIFFILFWIKVIPAGPPLQTYDCSVPCRTRTANSGLECSLPDLQCKLRIEEFPARTQLRAPDQSIACGLEPKHMSENIPHRMPKTYGTKCECQIECRRISFNKNHVVWIIQTK